MYKLEELLSHGIALVPIPSGCKAPATAGWNERRNVVTDAALASSLVGLNIGIAHAYCTPSPTCAIDIDDYKESKKWLAKQSIDLDALLLAGDAVVIHSGKINSLKLLYKLPTGLAPMASKSLKSNKGMMLEFRCASVGGLTVQDVLPPSIHPSGTTYEWMGEGSALAIPEIPAPLLAIWMGLVSNKQVGIAKANGATPVSDSLLGYPETPESIEHVRSALAAIDPDCDRQLWRDICFAVHALGWSCSKQLARIWSRGDLR